MTFSTDQNWEMHFQTIYTTKINEKIKKKKKTAPVSEESFKMGRQKNKTALGGNQLLSHCCILAQVSS